MGACSVIAISSEAILIGLGGLAALFVACLLLTISRR